MAPFGQLLFDFLMQAIGKVPSMPGLMDGFPPAPQSRVTLANWQDPPFNRWAFRHVREIIPTQPIPAGPAGAAPLAASGRDLGDPPVVRLNGRTAAVSDVIADTTSPWPISNCFLRMEGIQSRTTQPASAGSRISVPGAVIWPPRFAPGFAPALWCRSPVNRRDWRSHGRPR